MGFQVLLQSHTPPFYQCYWYIYIYIIYQCIYVYVMIMITIKWNNWKCQRLSVWDVVLIFDVFFFCLLSFVRCYNQEETTSIRKKMDCVFFSLYSLHDRQSHKIVLNNNNNNDNRKKKLKKFSMGVSFSSNLNLNFPKIFYYFAEFFF